MSPEDIIIRCGDCGWQGPTRDLVKAAGLAYCPKCGREFNEFPPRLPSQTTDAP